MTGSIVVECWLTFDVGHRYDGSTYNHLEPKGYHSWVSRARTAHRWYL